MQTMKYATIVECRKCGRKGRRSAMVRHFRAKHVKPEHQRHYCTACDFGASRKRSMETHFLSKSHRRKAKGRGMAECFRLGSVRAIRFSDRREDNSCDLLTLSREEARAFLDRDKNKHNSQESDEGSDASASSPVDRKSEVRSVVTRPIPSTEDDSADGSSPKDYTGLSTPEDVILLDTPEEPQASTSKAEPAVESALVEEPQSSTSKVEQVAEQVVSDKAGKSQLTPSKTGMVTGPGNPTAEMKEPRPSTSKMEVVQGTPQLALSTITTNVPPAIANGHTVDNVAQQPPLVAPGPPKSRIVLLRGGKPIVHVQKQSNECPESAMATTLASEVCGPPHQPPQVELGATRNSVVSAAGDGPVIPISIDRPDYVIRLLDRNNWLLESILSSNLEVKAAYEQQAAAFTSFSQATRENTLELSKWRHERRLENCHNMEFWKHNMASFERQWQGKPEPTNPRF